jgi:hypothetical protein
MYLFVIGISGRFSEWCDAVAARLTERASGPIATVLANSLEELAIEAMRSGASHAVIASRQPAGSMRQALIEADCRFVVALEDPRTALLDLVAGRGIPLPEAIQTIASSSAAVERFAAAPGALVLHGSHHFAEPASAAIAIARHLGIEIDDAAVDQVASDLAREGTAETLDAATWWSGLSAAERDMTTGALSAYIDRRSADDPLSLTWTSELFFRGDRPEERLMEAIDITGRPRCLVQGPHIMLPAGAWSLSISLGFIREAAEHAFTVEVSTDRVLASGPVYTTNGHSAAINLDFTIDEATERPVAIRISSMRAAFGGAIAVEAATLARISPTPTISAVENVEDGDKGGAAG